MNTTTTSGLKITLLVLAGTACNTNPAEPPGGPAGTPLEAEVASPEVNVTPVSAATKAVISTEYSRGDYAVYEEAGRLWVLRKGSQEEEEFLRIGEPAKHVIFPGAGPDRTTLLSPDRETVVAYLTTRAGFEVIPAGDRIWVFRTGSTALREFEAGGEPAKRVILPAAGPLGMTVMGAEKDTLEAYLRSPG